MSSGMVPAQPERILKALAKVWTSLAEEERQQGKPSVVRACAMTLIVATDEEDEEAVSVAQTLTELMHVHPSRAVVLRLSRSAENGLSSRVFAQCWKPFGKAQQICCEQIEIEANQDRWPDVGPTVLGIIVPDLPVVVWCRQKVALQSGPNQQQRSGLEAVLLLATKIIVDTQGVPLNQAFETIARWKSTGRVVADLEWTRLTPWREAIAHAFDEPLVLRERGNIKAAEVLWSGETIPASALYMAAWLQTGLAVKIEFRQINDAAPGVQGVVIKSNELTVNLSVSSDHCMRLRIGEHEQGVSLAGQSAYELMREELTLLGPDRVFDSVFERARSLQAQ
jgi:glucose-6-phosphate dehydrogenase assembly protein OpcA